METKKRKEASRGNRGERKGCLKSSNGGKEGTYRYGRGNKEGKGKWDGLKKKTETITRLRGRERTVSVCLGGERKSEGNKS